MPEDNPVTIIQFDNSMEANLVKTLLEDNGIMCFLADENLASVNPLYSDAIGRIKLQVPENQRDKAAEILKENDYDFKTYEQGDNIKVAPCSKCNSRKVSPEKFSTGFIIFS